MTKIKKKKLNFKDKRGSILDIFQDSPKEHCTIVTFNKNAVRGNHFHKKSTQYTYVISGQLTFAYVKINKKNEISGQIKKKTVGPGTLISHDPFHAHAFKSKKKSIILAFADGVRGGNNYEKDTFRLEKKLLK